MKHKALAGLIFLLMPVCAAASVRVTEVMYDLPGSDSGREWVEVRNDSADIDLKDYKFFNKDGGHLLKAYGEGSTLLPNGGVAILADKPDLFLIDWPQYTGLLIDSSFSLVSSDTIGIKDQDGAVAHSVSYTSEQGGKGDGNSLHYENGIVSVRAPTPGITENSSAPSQAEGTTTNEMSSSIPQSPTSPSASSVSKPEVPIKRITVDAGGDRTVIVGATAVYSARVYGTLGEPIVNPRLIWNFGNGESREGQTVLFTYEYPGAYTLMVTGAAGEYSATDRVLIEAHRAMVALEAETDGTLLLLNREKRELDVSLWMLSRGGKIFRIPSNTIILGGGRVPFSAATTGLPNEGNPELLYPNGTLATGGEPEVLRATSPTASLAAAAAAFAGSDRSSYETRKPGEIAQMDEGTQTQAKYDPSFLWWFSGALGLGALGAASVLFMRTLPSVKSEASSVSKLADTYEIIE